MPQRQRKRLRRFKREGGEKLPLQLQPRDREIMRLVHDHRFLSSKHIRHLVSGSAHGLLRRLQKLFHHGYLDRLHGSIYKPILYALGNKGADEVTLRYGIDRGKIDWTMKNREVKHLHIDHTLMVNHFRITLTLALKKKPNICIVTWLPEGDLKDEVTIQDLWKRTIRSPLIPDAFFTIKTATNYHYHFFLEADRSTMTNKRFLNKMKAYWNYKKQGKHRERLNIPGFRVITICKSEERKENLRTITRHADPSKTGNPMFLFGTEKNFNIHDPKTILSPIWQTPKDHTYYPLLP